MKILVTFPINEQQKKRIESEAPKAKFLYCTLDSITDELLTDVDIILGNLKHASQARQTKNLKWIQLNTAGTEGYCNTEYLSLDVMLTNATGVYGLAISEHMIGNLFMLKKKLHLYYANQMEHIWKDEGYVDVIEGCRVLSIGMGDIGSTFLQKMKMLGCYTVGIKRTLSEKPSYVDELYTIDQLDKQLPLADVVALSMPGNEETRNVLDARRFELMKKSAVLLNVGRGITINTDDLTKALETHKIAGAALDVTEPEPLPADHPLWNVPNVLITPHVSGGFAFSDIMTKIVEICAENLRRYMHGETLHNVVNRERGYAEK